MWLSSVMFPSWSRKPTKDESQGNDGTTSAAATPTVNGLKGTDTVTGLSESYVDKEVGTNKTPVVNAGYVVNDGNNYAVTTVDNTTGVIKPANEAAHPDDRYYGAVAAAHREAAGREARLHEPVIDAVNTQALTILGDGVNLGGHKPGNTGRSLKTH
jgi:hypothetical protein